MKYWREPFDKDAVPVPRGVVHILVERCKGCGFCLEYCPTDILVFSQQFNRKGYHYPVVVEGGECVHCALCEVICPDFAIYSVAAGDSEVEVAAV